MRREPVVDVAFWPGGRGDRRARFSGNPGTRASRYLTEALLGSVDPYSLGAGDGNVDRPVSLPLEAVAKESAGIPLETDGDFV
jgi:hypothetical protein